MEQKVNSNSIITFDDGRMQLVSKELDNDNRLNFVFDLQVEKAEQEQSN